MVRSLVISFCIVSVGMLSGCDTSLSDAINHDLSFFSQTEVASIELLSNTTQEEQPYCSRNNQIKVKISFPAETEYLCRDMSTLSSDSEVGLTCEQGVEIKAITVDDQWKSCSQITFCGKSPDSKETIEKRFDGGEIQEWTFDDLPWGCAGEIQFVKKNRRNADQVKIFQFDVVTPKCPFCTRLNKYTCAPCSEITDNEEVASGQVINKTCSGGICQSCPNDGDSVNHGSGYTFYKVDTASCGAKCVDESLVRVCNDGFFEGDPAFQHKQCIDAACGCQVPGKAITYDSGTQLKLYKSEVISCGTTCSYIDVQCNDGKWIYTAGDLKDQVVQASTLVAHNKESCTPQNTCRCQFNINGNIGFISATGSRSFYKFETSSCSEPKNCYTAENYKNVKCSEKGVLESFDSNTFKYLSCRNPTCQCYIDGARVDAGDTIYRYKKKIANEGETCASLSAQFTCEEGGTWASSEKEAAFPYASCEGDSDSGSLGGTGGGNGNDDGPGSALRSRFGLGDGGGGGTACIDGTQCRANITETGFSKYKKSTCPLPWGNGEVGHYGSIIAFNTQCVVSPGKCEEHRQSRTCVRGGFTGSSSFIHETCEEKASCP